MFKQTSNFIKPGLMVGLVMLVVMLLVSYGFSFIFPQILQEYSTQMYRSYEEPIMMLFFLYPFILGIIISWIWMKTSIIMKGDDLTKAVNFTLVYILVAQIPGMFVTYTTMNVSLLMIMSWMLGNTLQVLFATIILSKMTKKKVSIF
jgi:hypothetical protein